jgi:F-type H+-transporting ATPase subunit b
MTKWRRYIEVAIAAAFVAAPSVALAAGSASEGGEAGAHAAGFDWVSWLIQMFNFAIFAGIILYWGLPVARNFFKERREEMVAELEEAKRMREEAEARLEEYTAKLEALDNKRDELLDEYHEQGEREKERLIEEAKEQIEKMRDDAETTIEQEVRKAVANLEEDAVEMAVEIARKVARDKLDASRQQELIDEYVTELSDDKTDTRAAT